MRSWARRFGARAIFGALALAMLAAGILAWPLPERLDRPDSRELRFADQSPMHVFLAPDGAWRLSKPLLDIDPLYLKSLLALEDERYYLHPGVDPLAVLRAAKDNLRAGRVVSGASTISMQLARLLTPRERSIGAKLLESLSAVHLSLRLGKDELLAHYLRFLPFGRNLEGVDAAALAYFGHPARHLTPLEIATLLAVPQRPAKRYPAPENQAALKAARNAILERLWPLWQAEGAVASGDTLAELQREAPPTSLRPMPRHAIHAAFWAIRKNPDTRRLTTTLLPGVQQATERLLAGMRAQAYAKGVHNAAVIVIENAGGEPRALVGNYDFWDEAHAGQMASFAVRRSPGSALKPFIYAMALDRGYALPDMLVEDLPQSFGSYMPKNYEGDYLGLLPLSQALALSRNVPFVALLNKIGVNEFVSGLARMGATSLIATPDSYGLAAALGAAELTPLELAQLYRTLAQASTQPSGTFPDLPISAGAAYLTREALMVRERPDFPARRRLRPAQARIAWKTGTSYGHRDAWAVGFTARYTALVWQGNLDNRPAAALSGAEMAAPLLFDLLETLDATPPLDPPRAPDDLAPVEVCEASGHLPGPACGARKHVLALRSHLPPTTCPYHVEMSIDLASGLALSPDCMNAHAFARKRFWVWPLAIRDFALARHSLLPEPPAYAPGCRPASAEDKPLIVSPAEGQVILLLRGLPPERQQVPLLAGGSRSLGLNWFADGRYIGKSTAGARLWWVPSLGEHEIILEDETGQRATRRVRVERHP